MTIEEMNRKCRELKAKDIEFQHQRTKDRINQKILNMQIYMAVSSVFVVDIAPIPGSILA